MMRRASGFTLIEVIIVVALVSVMLVVLAQFFFSTSTLYRKENADLAVNYAARAGLDDVDSYVRQATQTIDSYAPYTAGPDVLILEIGALSDSNQLVPGAYDKVIFYLSGSSLWREIVADPASTRTSGSRVMAENISSLTFTYDNVDFAQVTTVETSMDIMQNTGRETVRLNISSKSRLRN
jgi:prepilin-type N-terminal cleavage/methylation domain-containing protein